MRVVGNSRSSRFVEHTRGYRTYRLTIYRWRTSRGHLPKWRRWLPWGQWHDNIRYRYAELYLPGVGGVTLMIFHRVAGLLDGHGRLHMLRSEWIDRAEVDEAP